MNRIAEVIARRRKELGLTQKELSEKLNVSDKTLSRWETGKQIPDALTLLNIAEALNMSIPEMYGKEEGEVPQTFKHVEKAHIPIKKLLKFSGVGVALIAAITVLIICIGNHMLQSKVSYAAKEVPMYALTTYDHSILDWIKRCNEGGEEINCISSLERDPKTGKDIAHYLFYLPHGYEGTDVRVRYQFGRNANVMKLDFRNTTQSMDENYYLCYVQVEWEDKLFGLEASLDGKYIRLQGLGFANHFVKLCSEIFADE